MNSPFPHELDDIYVEHYNLEQADGIQMPAGVLKGGYSLWKFTGGAWVILEEFVEHGFERGMPPVTAGAFEGHIKKTPGRRKHARS